MSLQYIYELTRTKDAERATAFNSVDLDREFGFPITYFGRKKRSEFGNLANVLNLEQATTLFYNFYGGLEVQLRTRTRGDQTGIFYPYTQDIALNGQMSYQDYRSTYYNYYNPEPYRRHRGGSSNSNHATRISVFGDNPYGERLFFTSAECRMASVTADMDMIFSGDVPDEGNHGHIGFGIKDLLVLQFSTQTSRYYGGLLAGEIIIGSNAYTPATYPFGLKNTTGNQFAQLYDGSYEKFLAGRSWEHPALRPDVTTSYNVDTYHLTDNQGTVIPLNITTAYYMITNKIPKYEDRGEESVIVGANPVYPAILESLSVSGRGHFYNYVSSDINPSPVLRQN